MLDKLLSSRYLHLDKLIFESRKQRRSNMLFGAYVLREVRVRFTVVQTGAFRPW
jgi:hypothetical protein